MNTVFITGGRGFIGEQLIRKIVQEGDLVRALVRNRKTVPSDLSDHSQIDWIEGDLLNPDSLVLGTKGCNQTYHLAAFAKPWAKNKSTFSEINIKGTESVLQACEKNNITDIVITSSAGTFGPQQTQEPITEKQEPTSWFTEYERTKWESVLSCESYIQRGFNIRFVSPTRVFGPGALSTSNAVTKLIGNYAQGKFRFLPGDGNGIGNYAFIDDVVNGHIKAMKLGRSGENYILGGENLSYREFFSLVGDVCGKHFNMIGFPLPLMLGAAKLMETSANLFGIEPLITPPFVRKYAHHWGTDLSKAQSELGYDITPAKKAIEKTFTWLQQGEMQH